MANKHINMSNTAKAVLAIIAGVFMSFTGFPPCNGLSGFS